MWAVAGDHTDIVDRMLTFNARIGIRNHVRETVAICVRSFQ